MDAPTTTTTTTTADVTVPHEWQGLTTTQRDICVTLAIRGESLTTEIADALGAEYTNRISRALPTLRDHGLVQSSPADDRPGTGKYHRLTDAGKALIADANIRV